MCYVPTPPPVKGKTYFNQELAHLHVGEHRVSKVIGKTTDLKKLKLWPRNPMAGPSLTKLFYKILAFNKTFW